MPESVFVKTMKWLSSQTCRQCWGDLKPLEGSSATKSAPCLWTSQAWDSEKDVVLSSRGCSSLVFFVLFCFILWDFSRGHISLTWVGGDFFMIMSCPWQKRGEKPCAMGMLPWFIGFGGIPQRSIFLHCNLQEPKQNSPGCLETFLSRSQKNNDVLMFKNTKYYALQETLSYF